MQPNIQLNYWAILAAIAASMVIGFLWYGPILGKTWMKEMGLPADHKPALKVMQRGMILMVIGSLLTAVMLAYGVEGWRLSAWKVGPNASIATYGFFVPFFAWIGFCVPLLLGAVAWETGPGSCSASTPPIPSSACRPWG
jgi:cytochrome c oxidase assembly factor CtaG